MSKLLLLGAAIAAAAGALIRRKQTQVDSAALWREATADASH